MSALIQCCTPVVPLTPERGKNPKQINPNSKLPAPVLLVTSEYFDLRCMHYRTQQPEFLWSFLKHSRQSHFRDFVVYSQELQTYDCNFAGISRNYTIVIITVMQLVLFISLLPPDIAGWLLLACYEQILFRDGYYLIFFSRVKQITLRNPRGLSNLFVVWGLHM